MKIDSEKLGASATLVAYVVPLQQLEGCHSSISQELQKVLPEYMVPQIVVMDKLPLNRNDKIDRKELARLAASDRNAQMAAITDELDLSQVSSRLKLVWMKVLALPKADIIDHDDFYEIGGTSMQTAVLVHQLREAFGLDVTAREVFENTTFGEMTAMIERKQRGEKTMLDETHLWLADTKLADEIIIPAGPACLEWTAPEEGRVFVTGATGFVGVHLVADLLKMEAIQKAICLVRADSPSSATARLKCAMEKYQVWNEDFAAKLTVICGDLEDETFGLGLDGFMKLGQQVSVIFHMAARVDYVQPYVTHRPANVVGTLNVVKLACAGRLKPIHYSSTVSCYGPTGLVNNLDVVMEDDSLDIHLESLLYDNGYAQSQWVVEQMLRRCMSKGVPIAVYRPGFILGSTVTGLNNRDDFLGRLLDSCLVTGTFPILEQGKEFVTIDYVCKIMLAIAVRQQNLNHSYNIVPPKRSMCPNVTETFALITAAHPDHPVLQAVPYDRWLKQTIETDHPRMRAVFPMLCERTASGRTRWEMHDRMPGFDTTNTRNALESSGDNIEYPIVDLDLMKLYMNRMM